MSTAIVVGAGWSGLACAYYLTKAGYQVTLLEAAPQAGGRARSINYQDHLLDNGQHICLGAYHNLRNLLRDLNLDEKELFHISKSRLLMLGNQNLSIDLNNIFLGMLRAQNITWRDKLSFIKLCWQLRKNKFQLANDCSVYEWLMSYQQSDFMIKSFWQPLALAAMTTDIYQASAQIFINVLRLSFNGERNDSNWYLPAVDLSQLLPKQIEDYLHNNTSQIYYAQAIKKLELKNNKCIAVHSKSNTWSAEHIILAIPPWQASKLLVDWVELANENHQLNKFNFEPITTIYYSFNKPVQLPYPIIGMLNNKCQWVFDRSFVGQPHIISAVISGPVNATDATQNELAQEVLDELRVKFPHLNKPIWHRVINEKRAAFTCDVAIQKHRPCAKTNVSNLWLTGDYLQTGLPSTLESALLSGRKTAEEIIISPRSNQMC